MAPINHNAVQFYYFEPLLFTEAKLYLDKSKTALRGDQAIIIFDEWIRHFCKRACLFYSSQFNRFKVSTEKEFRRVHGVEDCDSLYELGLEEEWENSPSYANIENHMQQTDTKITTLTRLAASLKTNDQSQNDSDYASMSEIQLRPINTCNPEMVSKIHHSLDELWFDKSIQSTVQNRQFLKELPYDQYLQSQHWKKVRAAVILIYRAVCQAQQCYELGESWYGEDNESGLHVHHTSYLNVGNERFSDLTLVCSKHHKHLHQKSA